MLRGLLHMALNLIKKEETKGSNRVKFKRAGWNDDFLIKLCAGARSCWRRTRIWPSASAFQSMGKKTK